MKKLHSIGDSMVGCFASDYLGLVGNPARCYIRRLWEAGKLKIGPIRAGMRSQDLLSARGSLAMPPLIEFKGV